MIVCGAGYHACFCGVDGRACKMQEAIDGAYWALLAGMHDIDEGHPELTYEDVIKSALQILNKYQAGVG